MSQIIFESILHTKKNHPLEFERVILGYPNLTETYFNFDIFLKVTMIILIWKFTEDAGSYWEDVKKIEFFLKI